MTTNQATLAITAIRPHLESSDTALPVDSILGMLALMPGATLHIRTGLDHGDRSRPVPPTMRQHLWLTDADDPDSSGAMTDLRRVLDDQFVVIDADDTTVEATHRWTARPAAGDLGFVPSGHRAGVWTIGSADRSSAVARLWKALSVWDVGSLDVALRHRHRDDFAVSISLCGSTPPPLSVRAAATDAFDGLRFGPSKDESAPEAIHCASDEARGVLLLPVSGTFGIPAGFRQGPPRTIPVRLADAGNTSDDRRIRLGWASTDADLQVDVSLGDQELLRHIHIVGATGTGKSSLLAGIVHQLAHSDNGALLLDPHGTLVDRVVSELPAHAAGRVRVVRADDLEAPVALNPLATDSPLGVETAISDMGEMFHELFDPGHTGIVGPRFVDRVAHALRGLVTLRGPRASLLDVPLMLGHAGMRTALTAQLTDPAEKLWWENDIRNQKSGEYADLTAWVNSKFERFSASPALRAILGSGADTYDPADAMDRGQIVLVDLAKGTIGSEAARLLGYLLLNRFWVAAMNRSTDRRFHVIVDEAHSVMAGSLVNMLSEGRKFGVSVTVAHQFLGQLQPAVTSALSGNVGTTVTFRSSGPHLAEQVSATGGQVSVQTLANLPTLSAIVVRNSSDEVATAPHTLRVRQVEDHCERVDAARMESHSREFNMRMHGGLAPLDPDAEYSITRPKGPSDNGSFLDEWLEKRRRMEPSGTPTAAASSVTGSDEVA